MCVENEGGGITITIFALAPSLQIGYSTYSNLSENGKIKLGMVPTDWGSSASATNVSTEPSCRCERGFERVY